MFFGATSRVGVLGQCRCGRGHEGERKQHHDLQVDRARVAQSRVAGCHGPDSRESGASRATPHPRWGLSCGKGGSGAGIRTPIRAFKGRCPTIERRRSVELAEALTSSRNAQCTVQKVRCPPVNHVQHGSSDQSASARGRTGVRLIPLRSNDAPSSRDYIVHFTLCIVHCALHRLSILRRRTPPEQPGDHDAHEVQQRHRGGHQRLIDGIARRCDDR